MVFQFVKVCSLAAFCATAPLQLTFEQFPHAETIDVEALRSYDGRTVQIKGFLFKSPEDQWILTSEPNLPSCCIGASNKIQSQIVVNKQFNSNLINHIINVTGVFAIDVQRGDDGAIRQLYVLDKVEEVSRENGRAGHLVLGMIALAVFTAVWLVRQRRQFRGRHGP